MTMSESQENLVEDGRKKSCQPMAVERTCSLAPLPDKALTPLEKRFLLYVERGDCASVRRHIAEFTGDPEKFDINCVDPLNRTALIASIENENVELLQILLDAGAETKDGLLHAIKEQYVEGVEMLLEHEEKIHKPNTPYSWEAVDRAQSTFTPDITPLVLAAHMNNYEIIKILLDRGATLPTPHDVRCGCDECVASSEQDSLRHSQARINAYRALSSPSLIALSSRDPLLTAFELSWELRRLSKMENEFSDEYNKMRAQVKEFATSLLDHARTSAELDTILNHDPNSVTWNSEEKSTLERLKLAIDYKQKDFVAHPSVQQLLTTMWFDGLPGFRRLGPISQVIYVLKMAASYPVNSIITKLSPNSTTAKHMNKPFVKFINHCASYLVFLSLLGAASQRVEYLLIEWFGNDWMQEMLADWKRRERGSLPGLVESGVIMFIMSLILVELDSLWDEGLLVYITNLWNIIDFVCNMFYITWIVLRFTSVFIAWREQWNGLDPHYPREQWDPFDPMLLSEGMFAAGMIFSFLKLVHIFSVNPHLGPLQISLGRMIIDIIKFFFIYTLVLFAFGCGMNKLLWYYADLEMHNCYHTADGLPDFAENDMACTIWRRFSNLFETSQSLFWASFGMVDLMAFELAGIKSFTRFWALLMFGSYSVINVIVLLNMLIAMMSNSYQIISERSDSEWKFARSKLWMGYFEEGDVVPPPFNVMPSTTLFLNLIGAGEKSKSGSVRVRSRERMMERHDTVMRLLVRRYVTAEQRKRDEFGITEDDVMEIRQDISTLRYEIVDILKNNGMKTPDLDPNDNNLHGKKGKTMERRLLKDFQIGFVEGVINDVLASDKEPKDVFSKIARAIGKRSNTTQKKDWNADAKRRNSRRDLIGSTSEMVERRGSRQSLRRHILEQNTGKQNLDPNMLVEYNPRLRDVSPAARVAYAKFKMRKIQEEYEKDEPEDDVFEDAPPPARKNTTTVRPRPASVSSANKFAAAIKKTSMKANNKDTVVQIEPDAPAVNENNTASKPPAAARQTSTKSSTNVTETSAPKPTEVPKPAEVKKPDDKASVKSFKQASMKKPAPAPPGSTGNQAQPASRNSSRHSNGAAPARAASPDPAVVPGKSKLSGKVLQGWI